MPSILSLPPRGIIINGINYSWSSITVILNGYPLTGITSLNYKVSQVKRNTYNIYSDPISRSYYQKEYTCSISLYLEEIRRIKNLFLPLPGSNLTDMQPFYILVSYLNEEKETADLISGCEFTSDNMNSNQGDNKIINTYDLVVNQIFSTPEIEFPVLTLASVLTTTGVNFKF